MITCRYVGSDCSSLGEREFDTVGQIATLSEDGFREAVLGGAAFISDEAFKRVNFSSADLLLYGQSGERCDPSAKFVEKLSIAQQVYRDLFTNMKRDAKRILVDTADFAATPYNLDASEE